MIKNRTLKLFSRFSLFTKSPKTVRVQQSSSWLSRLFQKNKQSPSYLLLKQMFKYLEQTPILLNQFPFIKNDERFQQNWMTIHTVLLKNRLRAQQNFGAKQLEIFNYNCKVQFFPNYAKAIHKHMPVNDFIQHFSQSYAKRFEIFQEVIKQEQLQIPLIKSQQLLSRYNYLFRKLVYENRVNQQDYELIKFSKYYLSHRKYLFMLSYEDILGFQVKWGFQGNMKLIQVYK